MPRKFVQVQILVTLAVLVALPVIAQKQAKIEKEEKAAQKAANAPPAIWTDPGDVSTLDLFYGAGGKDHSPDPNARYKFDKEDMNGTNPKFDVVDDQGVHWKVKMGEESQAETVATRLLWAAGYFVDEDYYLAALKVEDLPKLKRGEKYITGDIAHGVRMKRREKDEGKLGDWDWFKNPFVGQREFNGLKMMMALVNNWDLAADNNAIRLEDGRREYYVKDVGASFGKTGEVFTRSKSDPHDYVESKFVQKENTEYVDFVMHSRPFVLSAVDVPNYDKRTKMQDITKHIPVDDARWLGQRLAMLSENQIKDAFRAGGYSPSEVDEYTIAVMNRIAELKAL
jgi:hypothetical protein